MLYVVRGNGRRNDGRITGDGVSDAVRRHLSPVVWAATVLQAVAAVATLADYVPSWAAGAMLVGIPLGSLALDRHLRLRRAEARLRESTFLDRHYARVLSRWTFCESSDPAYWDATHHGERDFVVLQPIRAWTWSIHRRSDDDVPNSARPAVLRNQVATRSGHGHCVFRPPHKQKSTLAFRVEFEPPLRPGERVTLAFDLDVNQHKPATLERLRERPRPAVATPGEAEFTSYDVVHPIDLLVKEVIIPERLDASHFGLQVLRRDTEFVEEAELVRAHGLFDVSRTTVGGESAWRLRLERLEPPLRTTYRLCWTPPST